MVSSGVKLFYLQISDQLFLIRSTYEQKTAFQHFLFKHLGIAGNIVFKKQSLSALFFTFYKFTYMLI